MKIISLTKLNMHDTRIVKIIVDKTNIMIDRVDILLDYIESYTPRIVKAKILRFNNCLMARMNLNFGVIAPETIRSIHETKDSLEIIGLKERFEKSGITLKNDMVHYCFETNSTASLIEIIAEEIEFIDMC